MSPAVGEHAWVHPNGGGLRRVGAPCPSLLSCLRLQWNRSWMASLKSSLQGGRRPEQSMGGQQLGQQEVSSGQIQALRNATPFGCVLSAPLKVAQLSLHSSLLAVQTTGGDMQRSIGEPVLTRSESSSHSLRSQRGPAKGKGQGGAEMEGAKRARHACSGCPACPTHSYPCPLVRADVHSSQSASP